MDAALSLKFEKKAILPADPRTKLFLTITVSTIMITGGTGGFMNFVRPCLMACPIVFLLLSKKWKAAARFTVTYAILFALELTVLPFLAGTLELYLRRCCWNLYAHASRIYYGILFSKHHNSKRICSGYGTNENPAKDCYSCIGSVSFLSYGKGRIRSNSRRNENERHYDAAQPDENARIPCCTLDNVYSKNWGGTICCCFNPRPWRTAKADKYLHNQIRPAGCIFLSAGYSLLGRIFYLLKKGVALD